MGFIEAPQIGPHVFYGQINIAGRDGPLYARSQVIYVASIDEAERRVWFLFEATRRA